MNQPDLFSQPVTPKQVTLKAFELDGVHYIRIIPGKKLFQSTMIHNVVTRGDIFAMRLEDSVFTIIPGHAKVRHYELSIPGNI